MGNTKYNNNFMFQESYMRNIAAVVGIAAVVALGAYTYSAINQSNYMTEMPVTISVTGEGEVFAKPDIATISFGVNAKEADAAAAQSASAKSVNDIMTYLKDKGVAEKDIKTQSYNLSPRYEYPQTVCTQWSCPPAGEPKLVGYEVTQSIEVKVRKTEDIGMLLGGIGELGATNVSGPTFTIDDDSALKAEARSEAVADAKAKAEKLASQLGVRIVRMTGFWEDEGPMPYYGYGMGGGDEMMKASADMAAVPEIPTGENTITSRVNITYEIK